jgi:uncharacterized protein YpbB
MDYRGYVILYILAKFGSERSVSGIYHLLHGKKSSQTIQDGRFFNILFLFNTLNHISREEINDTINFLEKHHFIEKVRDEHFSLTIKGEKSLAEQLEAMPFSIYLDGWKYHHIGNMFWKRYSFMVQCLSNLVHDNHSFLPITRDWEIQTWVKERLPRERDSRIKLAELIYEETEILLGKLEPIDASYFVLRLSSINKIGQTHEQCAAFLEIDENYARIRFQSALHHLIQEIDLADNNYFTLQSFITDLEQTYPLTASAKKTYELLVQGKSLDEISRLRKLRKNTIEDHVVELAINIPTFKISSFVNRETQQSIRDKIEQLETKRLKVIKDHLESDVSYFQIRLVMAKC